MGNVKWLEALPREVIQAEAKATGVNWKLIAAICQKESAGRPYALRYEEKWKYFVNLGYYSKLNATTLDTERMAQMFSYGLMQVMGSVARELGFEGPLPQLCHASINVHFGTLKLQNLLKRWPVMTDAISAYNQGTPRKEVSGKYGNQSYVDGVLRFMDELEG